VKIVSTEISFDEAVDSLEQGKQILGVLKKQFSEDFGKITEIRISPGLIVVKRVV